MSGGALDMTLYDLIKTNKKSSGQGRSRAAGPGPSRRLPNRSANRAAPYATPKAPESAWGHDMFAGGGVGGRATSIETGTKLYVSNLDYGVSNEDVKVSSEKEDPSQVRRIAHPNLCPIQPGRH